jgi:hypothetical protein
MFLASFGSSFAQSQLIAYSLKINVSQHTISLLTYTTVLSVASLFITLKFQFNFWKINVVILVLFRFILLYSMVKKDVQITAERQYFAALDGFVGTAFCNHKKIILFLLYIPYFVWEIKLTVLLSDTDNVSVIYYFPMSVAHSQDTSAVWRQLSELSNSQISKTTLFQLF